MRSAGTCRPPTAGSSRGAPSSARSTCATGSTASSSRREATSATRCAPSARGRGVATWALGEMLEEARARGIGQVLITCDEDNEASARVAEHHGAVLEDVRDTVLGRKCRFWITLDD
ncbi:GNAT family N-acetyltransferase [Streptomyces albidoflavus]